MDKELLQVFSESLSVPMDRAAGRDRMARPKELQTSMKDKLAGEDTARQ